jgi:hypothetical protein
MFFSPRAQESESIPNEGPLRAPSSLLRFLFPHPLPGYITAPTANWRRDCPSYCGFIAPYSPLSVAYVLTSLSTAR